MSKKGKWFWNKSLTKKIGHARITLFKGWDLTHGKGWFAYISLEEGIYSTIGWGFSKVNKFEAVKKGIEDAKFSQIKLYGHTRYPELMML
jgi:hypothetical protein